MNLLVGFLLAILIALAAWRAKALSPSGALGAVVTGGLIFGIGGWPWAVLLLLFFISSSGLSRLFGRQKLSVAEKFSKGSTRDWGQVFANGGLGALLAAGLAFFPENRSWWIAYAGAMAAVNADTWATELGVLSRGLPRLITTWQPVERGASGAISLLGTLAAAGGAGIIGLAAALFSSPGERLPLLVAALIGGLAGSLFDSLLGATLQAIYWCPQCKKETERHPLHLCGTPTTHLRGLRWLNNDWVNVACSLAGAGVGLLIYRLVM
jgi:uncharacterized protein (TIGR00297 family)